MAKTKSKISGKLIAKIALIALLFVLLLCTLAMPVFNATATFTAGGASTSKSYLTSMVDFLGLVFDGTITNGWAVCAVVFYFLVIALSAIVLLIAVAKLFAKKTATLKMLSRIISIVLVICAVVLLITLIVFAGATDIALFDLDGAIIGTLGEKLVGISWASFVAIFSAVGISAFQIVEK